MALEKIQIVDQIEILESGVVQVRTAIRIIEDGAVLSSALHRHVVSPGDNYSGQYAKVQAICAVVHTAEVVTAYKNAQVTPM